MKLTATLHHAKRFWWGKGWGEKPRINTDNFYWRMQWNAKRRRQVEVIQQTLPENVVPEDPNKYVRETVQHSEKPLNFELPWPYSKRPIKGTAEDPSYKAKEALVYHRHKRLLEPMNIPLHFTNTILEKGLPERIVNFQNNIKIDDSLLDIANRRINWCMNNDSSLRKLPLRREFPYLDQRPPRVFGVTENRKENNLLMTLQDIAGEVGSKQFGVNSEMVLQRITNPNCVLSMERDRKLTILDLECNFVTLLQNLKPNIQANLAPFSSPNKKSGSSNNQESVVSIHPLSWESGFNPKNIYSDDTEFRIPKESKIQTIYLANNNVRNLQDEDFQGRAIMFCYGYAMQEAKLRSKANNFDEIVLDAPITVQCIFTNPENFNVGAVLFQLNSAQRSGSELNRAWLVPSESVRDDLKSVLKNVITLNSNGVHF